MKHPFQKGQKVRCVRASDHGIPLNEGEIYTVSETFFGRDLGELSDSPEMDDTPGIRVEEVPGIYTADRFEEIR